MNEFIYGTWRGKPARQDVKDGKRYWHDGTEWMGPLGLGYHDEFKPFPDQLAPDPWASLHST